MRFKVGDTVIVTPRDNADAMTRLVEKGRIGTIAHIQTREAEGGGHLAWINFREAVLSTAGHINTLDLAPYESGEVVFAKVQ